MREYKASGLIQATPEQVWEVLVDTAAWPEWDPGCERIEGQPMNGARLRVFSRLRPGRAFKVTVTEFYPGHKMIWSSGLPLGLLRGERTFILTAKDSALTKITLREQFSGPLLGLIGGGIPDMNAPFGQFVEGLKQRVEART